MRHPLVRGLGALALTLMALPSFASAAYLDVFGSPAYAPGVGGYIAISANGVNPAGTAIGFAEKFDSSGLDKGARAVRWDGSGAAVELGNLGTDSRGSTLSEPGAINTSGTIVGTVYKFGTSGEFLGSRPVRWDAAGTPTELGNLGTSSKGFALASATSINNAGTIIVGNADKFDGSGLYKGDRGARWDASGVATELGNLGMSADGATNSAPGLINGDGTVIGSATRYDASGVDKGRRAVRWDVSGAAVELEHLGTDANGLTQTDVFDINDGAIAVGSARKTNGTSVSSVAVRWDPSGHVVELGNIGTDSFSGLTSSGATAINASGTAVGSAYKWAGSENRGSRAVRWDAAGTAAVELGNLGTDRAGNTIVNALDINNAGIIVGEADDYDEAGKSLGTKAVLWRPDGEAIDLNTLIDPASGWTLQRANSITDTNWIAGTGTFDPDGPGGQNPYDRLFLMHVPEPSGLVLLSLGGVAVLRRRRRCRG
jgi:hypothetical protein